MDVEHAYKMNKKGHKDCPSIGTDYLSPNKEKRYLNENNKDENEFFKEWYYPDKKTIICLTWWGDFFMKKCKKCHKLSIIKEVVFEDKKCKTKEVCINPYCENYSPFGEWKWKWGEFYG